MADVVIPVEFEKEGENSYFYQNIFTICIRSSTIMVPLHRRELLASLGVASTISMAGCAEITGQFADDDSHLGETYRAGWPLASFDSLNSRHPPHSPPTGDVVERWRFDEEHVGFLYDEPAVAVTEDIAYIGTVEGNIHTRDLPEGDGSLLTDLDELDSRSVEAPIRGVASTGDQLMVISDGLYVLDSDSGEEMWQYNASPTGDGENLVEVSPTITENTVYLPGYGVHALSRDSGDKQWHFETDGLPEEIDPTSGDLSWFVMNPPAVHHEMIYCSTVRSTLYAIEAESGEEVWRYESENGGFTGSPAVTDEYVVHRTTEDLYAFDLETGDIEWDVDISHYGPGTMEHSPVVGTDTVYLGIPPIVGYDLDQGEHVWELDEDAIAYSRLSSPVLTEDMLYAADRMHGAVFGCSLDDRTESWRYEEIDPEAGENSLITTEELVLYLTTTGELVALESA